MPGQLLPLRLFSNSISATAFSFSTMKLGKSIQPPRGVSIFSRMFPFKLKYLGLSPTEGFGRRRFSSISSSGRRISAIRHNGGVDRGEESQVGSFRGRGERSGGGKPKTLIDSEDELSDWISELKTDSFRVGTSSESDGDRSVLRLRGGAKGGGGGGRDSSATNFRDTFRNEKGGRNDFQSSKRPRDSRPPDFGVSRNSKGAVFKSSRGSPSGSPSKKRFISESEEDEDEELSPRRGGGNGIRGGGSSPVRRSGRDPESSFSPSRGVGNSQKGRKPSLLISEEEEEQTDDSVSSFEDLLSDEDSDEDNDTEDPKAVNLFPGLAKEDKAQPMPKASSGKDDSYLSQTRFDQCAVSSLSLKGIKDAGYERMTVVQEATLPVILKGKDVLAKAKTGTGKTVAFLLPAIEVIVKSPRIDRDQKRPPFFVLVVCPTRELANQAAAEANKLLKYHPSIGVQVVIGGVRLALEQKRMQANPCQILVATPGRLKDHIENTAGFATRLMGVKVLVLDEADQLLDMGFRKDIEKIVAAVPKQRQTLLFSATVSPEVRQICLAALKRDHEFINTVQEGGEETHSQVRQMHLVAPLDQHFPLLYVLLREHISEDVDYKVLVFCTTANVTSLVASLLSELNLNIREIHSRKNQSYRTRISDEFRKSKGLILVTSDVSARGVDYPDVTLVIQVGLPSDRQQYIHRLGRTGRKGKEGQGILLLAPWEQYFLSNIKDLPITKAPIPSVDPDTKKKVERAMSQVDLKNKEKAYQAWLGYYNSTKTGRDKVGLVQLANEFSRTMGLDTPPAIPKQVLGKMGLRNVPGLRSA